MASSVEQMRNDVNELDLNKASVEVKFAYHVTNVKVTYDKQGKPNNQPNWEELQWHPADDPTFDGRLLLGAPCVFFTTTLSRGDFPSCSMYPRYGVVNSKYWFVKVPLTYFNDHHILYIHKYDKQVRLLLASEEELSMIPAVTRARMTHVEKRAHADLYLRRDERDRNKYYSNDYKDPETKYYVNFVVCRNVKLGDGVEWDIMPHFHMPGKPDNEALRHELFDAFIKRLNHLES